MLPVYCFLGADQSPKDPNYKSHNLLWQLLFRKEVIFKGGK